MNFFGRMECTRWKPDQIHFVEIKTKIYVRNKIIFERTLTDCMMIWVAFSYKIFSRKPSENSCDIMDTKKDWQRNWTTEAKMRFRTKLFQDADLRGKLNEQLWTENKEPSKPQKQLREWPVTWLISWLWAVQAVPFGEELGNLTGRGNPFWKQLYYYSGFLKKRRDCSSFPVSWNEGVPLLPLLPSLQEEMCLKTVYTCMSIHSYWKRQKKRFEGGLVPCWDCHASIVSSKYTCWNKPLRRPEPRIPRMMWWQGYTIVKRIQVHNLSPSPSKTLKLELLGHALRRPTPRRPPSGPQSSRSQCVEFCKISKRDQINFDIMNVCWLHKP